MYIVSACLLGVSCRYDGKAKRCEQVCTFLEGKSYIGVCPEVLGGLKIPRPPAELRQGRIINTLKEDVTESFSLGSLRAYEEAVAKARALGEVITAGILKARSPSCGCGQIYDGSFEKKLIQGNGLFSRLLLEKGIPVFTEEVPLDEITKDETIRIMKA